MSSKTHWTQICMKCKEKTRSGHLVPPSMGEESIWICESINRLEQKEGMEKSKDWIGVSTEASVRPQCDRKKSFMTPCVIEDGEIARADDGVCVGCGLRDVTPCNT